MKIKQNKLTSTTTGSMADIQIPSDVSSPYVTLFKKKKEMLINKN